MIYLTADMAQKIVTWPEAFQTVGLAIVAFGCVAVLFWAWAKI